jgi:hypothetical protein
MRAMSFKIKTFKLNKTGRISMSTIKFVDQVSDAIEEKMRKDLVDYESSHGIDVNYRRFALVLYDGNEEAIGVLNAFTAFSEVYIDDL